jgi:(p)ppGpp synthase/HD superfamily hydrolase
LLIDIAFEKAQEWHSGQTYGEGKDYFTHHIYEVWKLVSEKTVNFTPGFRDLCGIVALLHDVLEDQSERVSSDEIKELFGVPVVLAVECLTDAKGRNHRERKLKSYHRIRSNDVTALVKVADRLVNM